MEGAKMKHADQLPKVEVERVLEEDLKECVHCCENREREKPVIVGVHGPSKEENPETSGCPSEPDFVKTKKLDGCQLSEINAAKELGNFCSKTETNAMESSMEAMRYATLLDEEFKVSCKGHTRQQKTKENPKNSSGNAVDGDSLLFSGQFQDCASDSVHTSHLQFYQRRLRKAKDGNTLLISPSQHRGKAMCKSILGLDLSTSVTCTPSYRLLPMKYLRTSSQLHPLRAEVLNDHWVCVPSGSQNYHLKHGERNPYEEKLQECEDDRCELDVFLECVRAAAGRIERLLMSLGSGEEILLDDHLTAIDLRCCERLYGQHGSECIDMIRKNPSAALPVLLDRLKQKQNQLLSAREDMDKYWRKVYSDNYKNSFDNCSAVTTKDTKSGLKKESMTLTKQEARSLARKRRGVCN